MKNQFYSIYFTIAFILIPLQIKSHEFDKKSYIRYNQVGYLMNDQKIAIVGSWENLEGNPFYLVDADNTDKVLYSGTISASRGNKNTPFNYNLPCNFSDFISAGNYRIKLEDGTISGKFTIGALKEYQNALKLVLEFFRSQRCGDTNPLLHKPCHLNDAKALIDASGGWHDAGDYIKFMITATYATVELLTAADYAYTYNFENAMDDISPKNGIPDLLEEAKIGLKWILKMTSDYESGNYYYEVSGEEDHNFWRMPGSDDSTGVVGNPRTLHRGWGGNLLGRSAAALSIAYRIFTMSDKRFAAECLKRAEGLFVDRDKFENVQKSSPPDFYNETTWLDDMVLGAAELYHSTKKEEYFNYVEKNLKKLNGDDIGWGNVDFLAYAACSKAGIETDYCNKIMKAILEKKEIKIKNDAFYLSSGYTWGTTALFTGDAQKAIMYYYLTSDKSFLHIATNERDYLLGRNNWGVSFVCGVGTNYPLNGHSQIDSLCCMQKGAVVGGPAEKSSWLKEFPDLNINNDKYKMFQSNIVYHDNRQDYYCNEAALDYTSPSVFLFLYNISSAGR
ncbi:MAG: glycoside hydrolase family 9 protein [Ignavibacteriaceae bacterium]